MSTPETSLTERARHFLESYQLEMERGGLPSLEKLSTEETDTLLMFHTLFPEEKESLFEFIWAFENRNSLESYQKIAETLNERLKQRNLHPEILKDASKKDLLWRIGTFSVGFFETVLAKMFGKQEKTEEKWELVEPPLHFSPPPVNPDQVRSLLERVESCEGALGALSSFRSLTLDEKDTLLAFFYFIRDDKKTSSDRFSRKNLLISLVSLIENKSSELGETFQRFIQELEPYLKKTPLYKKPITTIFSTKENSARKTTNFVVGFFRTILVKLSLERKQEEAKR